MCSNASIFSSSHLLDGSDELQREEGKGKPSEIKMTLNGEVTEKYERKAQGLLVFWWVLCQEMLSIFNLKKISQQSEDLADLEQLTRISNKFRSELDAGYFDRIGEGNFGYVYKAQKGKRDVAVKILKNKEDKDLINNFEREADMLR